VRQNSRGLGQVIFLHKNRENNQ